MPHASACSALTFSASMAGASEEVGANGLVRGSLPRRVGQLASHRSVEAVEHLRPIERHAGDALFYVEKKVGVRHSCRARGRVKDSDTTMRSGCARAHPL